MQEGSALYLEAVEVMEEEGQETMALDIFRQAIGISPPCISFFPPLFLHFSFMYQYEKKIS